MALCLSALSGCLPDRMNDAEIDDAIAAATQANSCTAMVDCAVASGCADDSGCRELCTKGATSEAAALVDATLTCRDACVERDCKALAGAKREECTQRCLVYSCAGDVLACAAAKSSGAAICTDIFGCLESCVAPAAGGPTACVAACAATLAASELALASKLADCMTIATNDGKAFATTCSAEVASCYAGGVSGSAECFEAFACTETCTKLGKSAAICGRECTGTLNVGAQGDYVGYAQCLMEHPTSAKTCDGDLVVCADPSGTLRCQEAVDEIQACVAKSGTESFMSCTALGMHHCKPGSAKPLLDFLRCSTENCADACAKANAPGCALCLTTKCKTQTDACNKS